MVESSTADAQADIIRRLPYEWDIRLFADGKQAFLFIHTVYECIAVIVPMTAEINQPVTGLRCDFRARLLYKFDITVGHIHILLRQPMFMVVQNIQCLERFNTVLVLCCL